MRPDGLRRRQADPRHVRTLRQRVERRIGGQVADRAVAGIHRIHAAPDSRAPAGSGAGARPGRDRSPGTPTSAMERGANSRPRPAGSPLAPAGAVIAHTLARTDDAPQGPSHSRLAGRGRPRIMRRREDPRDGRRGFIGSHVVDRCVEAGHRVAVVDDLSTGQRQQVNPAARLHVVDIRSAGARRRLPHRGARGRRSSRGAGLRRPRSVANPLLDAEINVLGSLNLLECCRRAGTRRFVYVSTGAPATGTRT